TAILVSFPTRRSSDLLPPGDRPARPAHRRRGAGPNRPERDPCGPPRPRGPGDRSMSFLPGGRGTMGRVSQNDSPATAPDPTAPVGRTEPPTLYTGIVLYSAKDPEASAMLVADGLIAWTGPEDTARVLHGDAHRVDATGCLITPGFVDAAATADGAAPAPEQQAAAAERGIVLRLPGPTGERDGVRIVAPVT